jgi:hypothetical protein
MRAAPLGATVVGMSNTRRRLTLEDDRTNRLAHQGGMPGYSTETLNSKDGRRLLETALCCSKEER